MADATPPGPPEGERLSTGIPGLDFILGGGLPRRALALGAILPEPLLQHDPLPTTNLTDEPSAEAA